MATSRYHLQELLEDILGSENVYFQPPESLKLKYDAIVYKLNNNNVIHADNQGYLLFNRYEIIYIHRNPDSNITNVLSTLQNCRWDRRYYADNLIHDAYTLYF